MHCPWAPIARVASCPSWAQHNSHHRKPRALGHHEWIVIYVGANKDIVHFGGEPTLSHNCSLTTSGCRSRFWTQSWILRLSHPSRHSSRTSSVPMADLVSIPSHTLLLLDDISLPPPSQLTSALGWCLCPPTLQTHSKAWPSWVLTFYNQHGLLGPSSQGEASRLEGPPLVSGMDQQ